mgnify:CR=1 FL=1
MRNLCLSKSTYVQAPHSLVPCSQVSVGDESEEGDPCQRRYAEVDHVQTKVVEFERNVKLWREPMF